MTALKPFFDPKLRVFAVGKEWFWQVYRVTGRIRLRRHVQEAGGPYRSRDKAADAGLAAYAACRLREEALRAASEVEH